MATPPVTEEREVDALIVGGGPGCMSPAITAAQVWPGRKILLIPPEEEPVVSWGIPCVFGTIKGVEHGLLSNAPSRMLGGEILCERVLVSFQFGSHRRLTAPAHPIALYALDAMHQISGNGSNAA